MPAALLNLIVVLAAAALPPSPVRWVDDQAAFLSPAARSTLDARLEGYQRATNHQVVVWIGRTLDGAPLDDWAVRTFAAWQLGRKGFDDGIAVFVLADDRAIDIEVGYGLEDRIPDAVASRVIRDVMTPRLRAGDRDGAVTAGVDALLTAIEGKPWTGSGVATRPGSAEAKDGPSAITWILGGLGLIAFLILAVTHPRMAMMLLWTFVASGRRGGFGGGGGGGGFGGGGGRSGGGGARGGW